MTPSAHAGSAGTTRLAPSPTGSLHLGNARTFLATWAMARCAGWAVRLRIEDLDRSRVPAGETARTIDLLRWLGLDWDGPVLVQSEDLEPYRAAMRRLAADGRIFRCGRTRREIAAQALSAPHPGEGETRFPAGLRPPEPTAWTFLEAQANHRFRVDPGAVEVRDRLHGVFHEDPSETVGDILVWSRAGVPTYQLAVVVDDARTGVTDVVRGEDLLGSAARQTLLFRALGHVPPRWHHLPLVFDGTGRRLAKRDGSCRLSALRDAGVDPARVIGLIAAWSGLLEAPAPMTAAAFLSRYDPDRPMAPVTVTARDHAFLLGASSG